MPLPLPNLDTRRWADLVDEGRALVPRYAPTWTDHNVHDPGITLMELFAYLVEGLIYRANRIPRRHRWKFLALAGFRPRPPRPARVVLEAVVAGGFGKIELPAGLTLLAAGDTGPIPFQTTTATTLVEATLAAVQVFDGTAFVDRTSVASGGVAFPAFGSAPTAAAASDPERSPAVYLGFNRPLPAGLEVTLYFEVPDGPSDERERLGREAAEQEQDCRPKPPRPPCTPCPPSVAGWCADEGAPGGGGPESGGDPTAATTVVPAHHSARIAWEYLALDGWRAMDAAGGEVADATRSLTLAGTVRLAVPGPMAPRAVGAVTAPLHWVRCRFAAGEFDTAPMVVGPVFNATLVEQRRPAWQRFEIAPGSAVTAPPAGTRQRLDLAFDERGRITRLAPAGAPVPGDGRPPILVLEYVPATPVRPGSVTLAMELALRGTGLPDQSADLSAAVANGTVDLRSIEPAGWFHWEARADLDASGPKDRHAAADPAAARITFGNGVRGRVLPADVPVVAAYAATLGAGGALHAGREWALADDVWNRAVLAAAGSSVPATSAAIRAFRNRQPGRDGADREPLESTEARAVAALWAHERLAQLAGETGDVTLDQLDRAEVLAREAPRRASTVLDYERLALDVPGTRVRRARAWAGLDPASPCLDAAGTVTVVVVPSLPAGRPRPSAGLIRSVRRYLERRRVLCTRLVVVGPEYVEVTVRATVVGHRGAESERVRRDVAAALRRFLDPLEGGPARRGWPFGRDVYRSEILAEIDAVPGVDHVVACALAAPGVDAPCVNLCVGPTSLVASGSHEIEVLAR